MIGLFEGISGQYIDDHGKCRVLNYDNGISLGVYPLPPFDIQEISNDDIYYASFNEAINFIRSRGLNIVEQHVHQKRIVGIWVVPKER